MAPGPSQHPTPTPSIPDAVHLRVARRHRAALLRDIHFFEQAIAAPAGDPDWRHRVSARLGGLRAAFAEHVVVTEGPEGLYAELLDHAPRLSRGVHVLIREHGAVVAAMSALARRARLPEATTEELRGWASDLLREMSRHRQRGADLVYQAYQTDIGGET
jgi:antitoxin (DNA-binding transcriptional repressor) of toxin-antitoxin stability system